jgi:hypothetical protein
MFAKCKLNLVINKNHEKNNTGYSFSVFNV